MKKRIILIAVVLIAAALLAVPALVAGPGGAGRHGFGGPGRHGYAGHGPGGGHGIGGNHAEMLLGHLRHLKDELDLTDQQAEQIKAIVGEAHEQNAGQREQLHGGFRSIAEVLLANPNDIAGAQAILDQQAAAERALKTNLLTATSKALNVLTPEQRAKLGARLAEHMEGRGHGR
jgi:periplasmic protein CpxP/Spy